MAKTTPLAGLSRRLMALAEQHRVRQKAFAARIRKLPEAEQMLEIQAERFRNFLSVRFSIPVLAQVRGEWHLFPVKAQERESSAQEFLRDNCGPKYARRVLADPKARKLFGLKRLPAKKARGKK